ncbi:MAG: toll/interleukin-1 receptor domain-containing protein [Fibromonadales bacterium]|nr:toll/interleukin-1 receptor domain-containing protein [Fibromonadales bacterium]
MANSKYEIFISYRRKGGYDTAKLLYDRLRMDGYSVSFDIDTLVNGNFDVELENRVKECKDFLLVLSPGIFDRFFDTNPEYDPENDWVRREIACALAENKNIVPLVLEGFTFPKTLPDNVKGITRKNALDLNQKYFEAAYEKMKSFLISKPRWAVRHKSKIIVLLSIIALAGVAYFYSQKSLELQEEVISKEKFKRAFDSIDSVNAELENMVSKEKFKRAFDSIDSINTALRMQQQGQKTKTLHWKSEGSTIEQLIFEKIKEAGFEKTLCSGNGIVVSPAKASCRENAETKKFNCSYTPEITFTTCDSKPITYLKLERIRIEQNASEAAAKEELAKKLKLTDFSGWIPKIKEQK